MSKKRDRVLQALETAGISYTLTEHPAVHTIEEMDALPQIGRASCRERV